MGFLYPLFLLGGLAVALPIVLHLLRRDVAPDLPFTAVHLLRKAPVERSRQRRLRDLLLLAARIAALMLLAAAFARPYVAGAPIAPLAIVAVDRSYSMDAPGVFARARERALSAVDAAPGRVAVLAFDDRAEVVAAPGAAAEARQAIAALAPGAGATRYGRMIARAAELAAGTPARLVVVTDLQRAGWEDEERAALPDTMSLEVAAVEAPAANVAVTGLRIANGRALVTLRNAGAALWRGRIVLSGTGAASEVELPGESLRDVSLGSGLAGDGAVTASVDDAQGFAADNSRIADMRAPAAARVLVIASSTGRREPAFYFRRALDAGGGSELAADVREPAVVTPADLEGTTVVALLSTEGLSREARTALGSFVEGGGGLLVAAGPDVEAAVLATLPGLDRLAGIQGVEGERALAVTDLRHPIFRPFGVSAANLGQVRFARAWALPSGTWSTAAAFTDGRPAVTGTSVGSGRVLLLASDVDRRWNDFPLHPGFVPFVVEAVRFVAGGRLPERDVTVGEVPAGVEPRPGVYDGPGGRRLVVNVDPREASVDRLSAEDFRAFVETVPSDPTTLSERQAEQTEAAQGYWQYGLLLMLGALVAESLAGRV